MWKIKKWQDDGMGACMVITGIGAMKEPYWKLAVLGAVYLVDGWWRDCTQKETDKQKDKAGQYITARQAKLGWDHIRHIVSFLMRYSSTYLMFGSPMRAFMSSQGYSEDMAKVALGCLNIAVANGHYQSSTVHSIAEEKCTSVIDQEKKGLNVTRRNLLYYAHSVGDGQGGRYDGTVSVWHSHISYLLGSCITGLVLNSFGDGANKYAKVFPFLCMYYGVSAWLRGGVGEKAYDAAKLALLRSAYDVAGMAAISEYDNFNKPIFKGITEGLCIRASLYIGRYLGIVQYK